MAESTLTSKGQTTIPREIRQRLGLEAGQRLVYTVMPDGAILLRVKDRSIAEAAGCLSRDDDEPQPVEALAR
jgi:AbrB family looped-hinge helix DNA binding protein